METCCGRAASGMSDAIAPAKLLTSPEDDPDELLLQPGETTVKHSRSGLGAAAFERLAVELAGNSTVAALYLLGNDCGDTGAVSLASALTQNTRLQVLDLARN